MASKVQDIMVKMQRIGYLQATLEIGLKRMEAIENELKQMEKDRDDIRQELEDTLWQVRRTNDTTDS